jgi:hypothetical protein
MKNYIGRKCKGFRFEDETDDTPWVQSMENHINEVGLIADQDNYSVRINFKNNWWNYPISLIEPYLIPESPEIPQLGEGIEMEVSDNGIEWVKRKVVGQLPNGSFLTPFIDTCVATGQYACVATWKHARPIQEVKKYTKEELVKIVGHDFEIV